MKAHSPLAEAFPARSASSSSRATLSGSWTGGCEEGEGIGVAAISTGVAVCGTMVGASWTFVAVGTGVIVAARSGVLVGIGVGFGVCVWVGWAIAVAVISATTVARMSTTGVGEAVVPVGSGVSVAVGLGVSGGALVVAVGVCRELSGSDVAGPGSKEQAA